MELYRGMSSLEKKAWKAQGFLPRGTLFTTHRQEALELGVRHLYEGELVLAMIDFDDVLFDIFSGGKPPFSGDWYRNHRDLYLTEVILSFRRQSNIPRTSPVSSQYSISGCV